MLYKEFCLSGGILSVARDYSSRCIELIRGVARNLIWVGINEFVLGQGDKTTT